MLDVAALFALLTAAAFLGDTVNYGIGKLLGQRVFHVPRSRWFNPEHLERTSAFFERHGAKTIVIARFVPMVRTFAPFVAGVGRMPYRRFVVYNLVGAVAWVGLCVSAGDFFGNLPFVKENFGLVVLFIIAASMLPAVAEWLRCRRRPIPADLLH